VHYGRIGSGDRSLRNASKRDEIAAAHDVLAIEMEGKGVGNAGFSAGVEWFVIRGVSDYGDGHVSRRWRKYASLAAAAYTRALLAECPPVDSHESAGGAGNTAGVHASGRSVAIGGSNTGVISTGDGATIAQRT
jgi:hypothetical protein